LACPHFYVIIDEHIAFRKRNLYHILMLSDIPQGIFRLFDFRNKIQNLMTKHEKERNRKVSGGERRKSQ